jgi:pimeloyl-ACP methyl ester carboxylesterase
MGDESDFTAQQLALDVRNAVLAHGIQKPFVLVGHSMGGRVAMRYAADYGDDLAALVIEDMDTSPRTPPSGGTTMPALLIFVH